MLTPPLIWLSSIAFHVIPKGPPAGPEPPRDSTPPLIVMKWICRFAGFVAWTPPVIVPLSPGASSLPSTNVAPGWTKSPPRMVTPPSLKQLAPDGTTTLLYVPGARKPVHAVVLAAAAPLAE